MKTSTWVFLFWSAFFSIASLVYFFLSDHEWAGSVCLGLTGVLGSVVGFYLFVNSTRRPAPPADRPDAQVDDGVGELDFFSPHSYWPLGVAFGAALVVLGLLFGLWLSIIGGAVFTLNLIGLLFQYAGPSRAREDPALWRQVRALTGEEGAPR